MPYRLGIGHMTFDQRFYGQLSFNREGESLEAYVTNTEQQGARETGKYCDE